MPELVDFKLILELPEALKVIFVTKIREPYTLRSSEISNVGSFVTPVQSIVLQSAAPLLILTVCPELLNELASKYTLSLAVGILVALIEPPEEVTQWDKSFQSPEPATQ